jgi:sugar/nucleoside kinase (ribokinase family)
MESLKDVIGIGNAVVDILSYATDKFLQENKFTKGSMTLVDLDSITKLQRSIENTMEISGGSVANSVVGVSVLGGSSSYIGKVHQDHLGAVFKGDLDSSGVILESGVSLDGSPTARCIVIITPDGERTMATYLGACLELTEDDIPIDAIRNHKVTYLEGYLFDVPNAKNAVLKAAEIAKKKGRSIALGLSDSLCVCRNRNSFRKFLLMKKK